MVIIQLKQIKSFIFNIDENQFDNSILNRVENPKYAISHKEHITSECEIYIETNAGVSIATEANVLLGYTLKKASASLGFETHSPTTGSDRLYSIFIETYESPPTNIIRTKRLVSRLKDMYR